MQHTRRSPRPFLAAVLGLCIAAMAPARAASAQPVNDPTFASTSQAMRIQQATIGFVYDKKNDGHLPRDMATIVPYMQDDGESLHDTILTKFMKPGTPPSAVPENATAAWVNDHASYVYIGNGEVKHEDLPAWGDIVLAYLRPDEAYPSSKEGGEPLITMTFADTHGEVMTRSEGLRAIEFSKQVIEAVRTGSALPDNLEVLADFDALREAIWAYAAAHNDELPPDLGATLPYVKESKRLNTPAKRAAIYLSPRIKKNTHVPDKPTPEWVNRTTRLLYFGGPGILRHRIEDGRHTALVCVRPEDSIAPVRPQAEPLDLFPILGAEGIERGRKEYYEWVLPYSRQVLEAARSGAPLPPLAHALRDLRLIAAACKAYAAANDGAMPPTLGAMMAYIPASELANDTPQERARVFLSPRAEAISPPPENADSAWVDAHATYRYVADPSVLYKTVRGASTFLLAHAPLDEPFTMVFANADGPRQVHPAVDAMSPPFAHYDSAWFTNRLEESKRAYQKARVKAAK